MRSLKGLLALFFAEAFLVVLWIFITPSEGGRGIFLWLSRERLALLFAALLLWLVISFAVVLICRRPTVRETAECRLDRLCVTDKRLGSLLIALIVVPLVILVISLIVLFSPLDYNSYRIWAPDTFPLLHSLVGAVLPLILLLVLLAWELAAFLALRYDQSVRDPTIWSRAQVVPCLLALGIGILTVFHWLVLAFQLHFFANNPAWYWKIVPVAFGRGDLLFIFTAILLLVLVYWLVILRRRVLAGLIAIFLLGAFLQLGVGLMVGGGFASFQERYFSTYHKTYISKASESSVSLLETVRQYEALYGSRSFTDTKPPGLMAFYTALDHALNGHPSPYSAEVRFQRLSALISYAFPLLAMLAVFAIYVFVHHHIPGRFGLVPALAPFILVLCPNLILFSLFPDQAIYPLLFLFGTVFIIVTVQRQSWLLAFLLAVFLYAAAFFAFTMLPLYPIFALYLALHYWFNRHNLRFSRQIGMLLTMGVGTLLLYLLFRLLLNYDFLPRFARAVAINHDFDFYLRVGRRLPISPEPLATRLSQILGAMWLNNLDFAAAVGFPLYLLFLVQAVRLLRRLFIGSAAPADLILAALLLSFVVLNLAGTAQGEVPRLWLFWLPMVVILAALEIEPLVKRRPPLLLGLGLTQLVTIFLTFHFQDLRM